MKVFVINLARSPERRASMEQQLSLLNLDYEIVEAVDGSQLSYTDIMKETRPLNYALSCGEVGCALSHINIYRRIAAEGIPLALILEDDALLNCESVVVMSEVEKRNIQFPTVTLLTETSQYIDKPAFSLSISKGRNIYDVLEASRSHGYIINQSAASKLIEFLYPVWMVADRWQTLREYSVCNIEAVIPPVIKRSTHSESSTIQIYDNGSKWLDEKKIALWKEIKKHRPLKVKMMRCIWTTLVRPFLKVKKSS